MGVEYRHHVIPNHRLLRPEVPALQALVNHLTAERFVPAGSFFVVSRGEHADETQSTIPRSFAQGTVSAIWNVDCDTPVRYPFAQESPYPKEEDYWDLELHLAGELLCYGGELVGPTNLTCVGCGTSLEREDEPPTHAGWLTEVALACPSCKRAVVPAEHHCVIDLDTRPPTSLGLVGGGLFRCGFFIECHKSLPTMPAQLDPTLRAILHETFGPVIDFPDAH